MGAVRTQGTASVLTPPRALIDAAPVGAISVDRGGTIQEWNAAAERLFGWARPEVVGRVLSTVLKDEHGEPFADTVRGVSLIGAELRLRNRSGDLVDVAVWTAPLGAIEDSFDGYVVIVADIAERKRLEAERTRRLREEAERAEAQARLRQLTVLAEASSDLRSRDGRLVHASPAPARWHYRDRGHGSSRSRARRCVGRAATTLRALPAWRVSGLSSAARRPPVPGIRRHPQVVGAHGCR
ncbi:MAG: PAS domain S-box protein [Chloroflexi bacterium]|nr:MAG: PAS domain S-box protein [Chloroflexota bacterium]